VAWGFEDLLADVTCQSSFQGLVWECTRRKAAWQAWKSIPDMTSHWIFLGSNIGTHTSKKWHEDFEDPLADMTFNWLFLGSSMGTHALKSSMMGLKTTCKCHFTLALFRVRYGKPHIRKVAWRFRRLTLRTQLRPFSLDGKSTHPKKVVQETSSGLAAKANVLSDPSFYASFFLLVWIWLHLAIFFSKQPLHSQKFAILIRWSHHVAQQSLLWFFVFFGFTVHSLYSYKTSVFLFRDFAIHSLYSCGQGAIWFCDFGGYAVIVYALADHEFALFGDFCYSQFILLW